MQYMKADAKNPNMGLNNKPCKNPVYWCRLHQVYLSESDAEKQHCKNKQDFDMRGTHKCTNLVTCDKERD